MTCKWSEQDWQNYLLEEQEEYTQKQIELHLAHCPACLEVYTELLTTYLPTFEEKYGATPNLEAEIMAAILPQQQRSSIAPRWSLLHYGIAASLAFLFFQTGVFDAIFTYTTHSQTVASQSNLWLEHALHSTEQWFAQLNKIFR